MNEPVSEDAVMAGQAVYSKRTLRMYDWLVLGFSNRFVWKCPTSHLLRMYNDNVTNNHLDVGVGTGFVLDRCQFPGREPRVALLDLNENCLRAAASRISRYTPECFRANLLEPVDLDTARFDSIAMNYVLHCLPGSIDSKSVVFEHLKQLLNVGGVLFGATILHDGVKRRWMASRLMAYYNQKRIFTNARDSLAGLESGLRTHFSRVAVSVKGCVATFVASDDA